MEFEREIKYLLKSVPDLSNLKSKKLVDIYIPRKQGHAAIRIRQQGDKFFITKKTEMQEEGKKVLKEETIGITEEDFNIFKSMKDAKILDKTRYYYPINNKTMEIDVFDGSLKGLTLAEVEFNSIDELKSFKTPEFCLADVTHEDLFAGGVLFKPSYSDISSKIKEYSK